MDDDLTYTIEAACTAATYTFLLTVVACALRSSLDVLLRADERAAARCRRWLVVTTIVAIACAACAAIDVDPVLRVLLAVAAFDCWLVTLSTSPPSIPRAISRRRRPVRRYRR